MRILHRSCTLLVGSVFLAGSFGTALAKKPEEEGPVIVRPTNPKPPRPRPPVVVPPLNPTPTPTPPAPTQFRKQFIKADHFGNDDWAAGYSVGGSLRATAAPKGGKDKLEADSHARTYARIAGKERRIFEVRADGFTEAEAKSSFELVGYLGGATLFSKRFESKTSTKKLMNFTRSWPKTFINQSKTFMVGPIPVNLSAKATGNIGAVLSGQLSNIAIRSQAIGTANADLVAGASVGFEYCALGVCVGAKGGVFADLTLIEAQAPVNAQIDWDLTRFGGVELGYKLTGDLSLHSLDGAVGLFAEAKAAVFDKRWEKKLIDWDGFSRHYTLLNQRGNHCLVGTCRLVLPQVPMIPTLGKK